MPKKINPYSEHLKCFKKELKKAGGAHGLMLQMEAIKENGEMIVLANKEDIENYKEKHLKGIYESLRPLFDTEAPMVFWSRLYDNALIKTEQVTQ